MPQDQADSLSSPNPLPPAANDTYDVREIQEKLRTIIIRASITSRRDELSKIFNKNEFSPARKYLGVLTMTHFARHSARTLALAAALAFGGPTGIEVLQAETVSRDTIDNLCPAMKGSGTWTKIGKNLWACCFDDGCWICDDKECELDPMYSVKAARPKAPAPGVIAPATTTPKISKPTKVGPAPVLSQPAAPAQPTSPTQPTSRTQPAFQTQKKTVN